MAAIAVLDCSIVLRWALKEGDGGSFDLEKVAAYGGVVPGIWHLEVANVLLLKVRHKKLPEKELDAVLADISKLKIAVDGRTDEFAWTMTLRLAEKHGLSAYDAAYLELALRRGLALATLDKELARAAIAERVMVLPA
jgi:predicted nucleic acid-binding protein